MQDRDCGAGAGFADPLMAMEGFIQVTMVSAQGFNFLHLVVVFLLAGKEAAQPGLELLIRMSGGSEQFSASRT